MKDVKTFFRMIGQVNYVLSRKQKIQFIGLFFLGLGSAFMQTLGVSAILPFVQAVMTPEILMQNRYIVPILNIFKITDPGMVIVIVGIGIILIYFIKNIYLIVAGNIQTKFRCRFHEELSSRLLS